MLQELLIKDLCARLPYGFTIYRYSDNANIKINDIDEFAHFLEYSEGEEFKPYLRPMSSMTHDEDVEYRDIMESGHYNSPSQEYASIIDWLNEHHLDYRGLIEKGLALEAPEDMYKN